MNKQYIGEMPNRYKHLPSGLRRASLEMVLAVNGYAFGDESPLGTDCSGIPSWAFTRCGYPMRMTADEYFKRVFPYRSWTEANMKDIVDFPCVFIMEVDTAEQTQPTFTGLVRAAHIAPIINQFTIIDAYYIDDTVSTVSFGTFWNRHTGNGRWMEIRYPSLAALESHKGDGMEWLDDRAFDYTWQW